MRVLLDENLPHDLSALLPEHDVFTVQGLGWAGVTNGELLRRASSRIDALLTMDRHLEQQQDLSKLPFGVIVLRSPSNRMADLRALTRALRDALVDLVPGSVRSIGA